MVRQQLTSLFAPSGWCAGAACAVLLALLSACSTTPATPAPTPSGTPETTDEQASPAPAAPARSDPSQATLALLSQSRRAERSGALAEAIAYAERAVRISPREAPLWTRLAELELANEQPETAMQYGRKALSLAGDEPDLQRDAWLVIADAHAAIGNKAEAARIRARWRTYRG